MCVKLKGSENVASPKGSLQSQGLLGQQRRSQSSEAEEPWLSKQEVVSEVSAQAVRGILAAPSCELCVASWEAPCGWG